MSGYLEVKYPFKSNLGLNPFKSWKRQWCILRPSPTFTGGVLAVYCSEAGAAAGTIELPAGFVVRRAKSRTRPHAFAVFPTDESRKPRVLLAASTLHDAQVWMEKIKVLINGNNLLDSEGSIKDSFSVTVTGTELSRRCGLSGTDSTVSVTPGGLLIAHNQRTIILSWKHIKDASLSTDSKNGTCILTVNSGFIHGGGALHFSSPLAERLLQSVRHSLPSGGLAPRALSKSDSDLNNTKDAEQLGEVHRSSWYSGPCEVSLDDLALMDKQHRAGGLLARCRPEDLLQPTQDTVFDDSMSDRRSVASVASGIYEEIPDVPPPASVPPPAVPPEDNLYCKMTRNRPLEALKLRRVETYIRVEEPTYECVSECVYATMRRPRRAPPPLPPRHKTAMVTSGSCDVPRAGSLGCLPPPAPAHSAGGPHTAGGAHSAKTLPRWDRSRHAFSAFRKRLKNDSSCGA